MISAVAAVGFFVIFIGSYVTLHHFDRYVTILRYPIKYLPITSYAGMVIFSGFAGIFLMALSVCAVEQKSPLAAFRRSFELTKGHRLSLAFLSFVVIMLIYISSRITRLIRIGFFSGAFAHALVRVIGNALPLAYANILPAVAYYHLRAEKDNLMPETLPDIFD